MNKRYTFSHLLLFTIFLCCPFLCHGEDRSGFVPEMLALKNGEKVPDKILLSNDSRLIGASLMERIRLQQKKSTNEKDDKKFLYDFYQDSEIQLAFGESLFHLIRKGCFKNQHQTNTSGGILAKKERMETENSLATVEIKKSYDSKDPSQHLRPKYGYFVPTKPMDDVPGNIYVPSYGNIYAVLKEEVKDRASFTATDSLEVAQKAESFRVVKDYKKLRADKFSYWEAQIWGDVCFSDIAHFLINCPGSDNIKKEALEEMKETGIPVYDCQLQERGVNSVYVKGKLFIPEDTQKRIADELSSK